jgi:tRNA dimethylallyltransferase
LAQALATSFRGEIVNCDSVQVYRGLELGSAKTPEAQRSGIPHHLLDVIPPNEELTAGSYVRMAVEVLAAIRSRGTLPIVAGGTGFYLRALIHGLSPAPTRNEALRARLIELARRRPAALERFLRRRDAAAAGRIHPNDHQKLMRAIELAGHAAAPRQALAGFRVLKIGLNPERALLNQKLNDRTEWMFANGLLDETQALLQAGVSPSSKALATIGYRQAVSVISGGVPLAEAIADCRLRTRHYAKRQLTWFRAEPDVHWLSGFGGDPAVRQEAHALVRAFLG